MSHHEANKIRRKLVPFMTLLLAVACMGLLASCGGGGNSTTNSDLSNIPTNTFDRPLTAENVIVSERTGFAMVKGEVIVTLEDQNQFESFKNRLNPEWQIVSFRRSKVIIQTNAIDENQLMENIATISAMTGVLAAIENRVYVNSTQSTPNDPDYQQFSKSWHLQKISLQGARDIFKPNLGYGFGVGIGIVDSKFSVDHQDITFRSLQENPQPIYGGPIAGVRGSTDVDDNHGMHVAGIIGAKEGNNIGSFGIAPAATIDVFDPFQKNAMVTDDSIIFAIEVLADKSKIINFSLGNKLCITSDSGKTCATSSDASITKARAISYLVDFYQIIEQAKHKDKILLIQSSGNEGAEKFSDGENITAEYNGFLASILSYKFTDLWHQKMQEKVRDHSIVVGAIDNNGVITDYTMLPSGNDAFSDFLKDSFIVAPGGAGSLPVYSTYLTSGESKSTYGNMAGTSMAAPHVTGVAALVMQAAPDLTAPKVREILLKNADSVKTNAWTSYPYPSLNAEKAVQAALATLTKPTANISVITPKPTAGTETIFRADVTSTPNGVVNQIEWDFGDGTVQMQTGSEMFHTYTSGGTYTVKLKIKDVKGVTNTTTKEITVAGVAIVPTITDLTFTPATANTAAKLTAVFSTDMQSGYKTTGAYVLKVGKEGYWPNARTFVAEFSSVTSGGQITLVASGFKSVSGQPMAADRVYTFPGGLDGTFKVAAISETGKLFVAPSTASSCTFTASGVWDSTSAYPAGATGTGPINNIPLFYTWNWRLYPGNFMSLIASNGSEGYVYIGDGATLNVASNKDIYFFANDGIGAHYDNGGELTVSYSCQ